MRMAAGYLCLRIAEGLPKKMDGIGRETLPVPFQSRACAARAT